MHEGEISYAFQHLTEKGNDMNYTYLKSYLKSLAVVMIASFVAIGYSYRAEAVVIGGYDFHLIQNFGIVSGQETGNYSGQAGIAMNNGWTVAPTAIIDQAISNAGLSGDIEFLSYFYSGNLDSLDDCDAEMSCQYRFGDASGPNHWGVVLTEIDNVLVSERDNIANSGVTMISGTFPNGFVNHRYNLIAYTAVSETPEPSLTILFGSTLMGLSYLAYRRQKN